YSRHHRPSQPVADRIYRALRHRLRLLHRSESSFFILGATGNVYTVTLSTSPSCTCPDRTSPCKHILFVLIRVLGVSLDDACLRRRSLRPCKLTRLLGTPTLPEAMAGVGLRERFHRLFFQGKEGGGLVARAEVEDGATCPVCLEEMGKGEKVVGCGTCGNGIHEECLLRWKRSRGRRAASCVLCRAKWRDRNDQQDKYLNLAAYVDEDDMMAGDDTAATNSVLSFAAGRRTWKATEQFQIPATYPAKLSPWPPGTGVCILGGEECSGGSGPVQKLTSCLRFKSSLELLGNPKRRGSSLWELLPALITVLLLQLYTIVFPRSLDYCMDGQLGTSGENSAVPHLMDQFLDLRSPSSLQDDSETNSGAPLKICSVKAGGMMSLAIDNVGGLWMWGNCPPQSSSNEAGFSLTSSFTPLPVWHFHGHTVVKVACGNEHVVALVTIGETYKGEDLVCYSWGNNNHGQLGLGDTESRIHPEIVEMFNQDSSWAVYEVACGAFHTALLTHKKRPSDTLESLCWTFGLGDRGQLGHGTTQSALKPEAVKELPQYVYLNSVDCGLFHTSVVSSAGDVWSWGMEKGLGLCPEASFDGPDSGDAISPRLISGNGMYGPRFQDPLQVSCGAAHTVLVANDGYKLWSWGRGRSGVLGNGNSLDCFSPTLVMWPPLTEDFNQEEVKPVTEEEKLKGKGSEGVSETEKRLSLALEDMKLLQSKLSTMERYASILHGSVFGRPFTAQDIPMSLQNSGTSDIAKEWENMLESADHSQLVRLEMFYRQMLAGVKDKQLKRRIQELIREMLALASDSGGGASANGALVPFSPDDQVRVVLPLRHGLKPPISRVSISWARGNSLRVSLFRPPPPSESETDGGDEEVGGKVVEVKLSGNGDGEISDAQWRKIAYGSVSPFALLQSRRNSFSGLSKMQLSPSPYHIEWWEYVMEYSKDIGELLGSPKSAARPLIEDPREVLKKGEEPKNLKAAWELLEMFYVDKLSQSWLPERLVDWLADYDCLLSATQSTIHSKLVEFQGRLVTLQVIEDDPKYWEIISSALAVGWLEIVVKLLHLHGSYQLDQLGTRETENGLVEAVAVLISKTPRMRPALEDGKLGECFKAKPEFMKAWEKWRAQITKLESSAFWVQCGHRQTREGLKNMLQIMLGNANILCTATFHWIELYISHFLYIRPFTVGLENMYNLAQKCIQWKPISAPHKLMWLLSGILEENTEERQNLGGISIEELHRLAYAQVLSSHPMTWQNLEICRLYDLDYVSSNIMKIAGVHHWKHGRKGSGVFWLQQARDEVRLNWIAQQLFDSVGKSISSESFKVRDGKTTDAAREAVESLMSLMRNPSTPQQFWLPLLHDSLKLLSWQAHPLLSVSQTNLLLNKLQELSTAKLRPDFVQADLPPQALSSVRLALATNLGRAILEEQ
ncbi:hypothetical protein Tsubulata_035202, partial [Turnera subulata]